MIEMLPWLQMLLVPMLVLLASIKTDLAALRSTQEAHDKRLNRLEQVRP